MSEEKKTPKLNLKHRSKGEKPDPQERQIRRNPFEADASIQAQNMQSAPKKKVIRRRKRRPAQNVNHTAHPADSATGFKAKMVRFFRLFRTFVKTIRWSALSRCYWL